ncbi:SDR family oxidoreductase [Sphingobium aromaticiconvertens]|uniref:SDR family NAD(P)-dependent oxidoreductase n=1 Tax=Sphingobium aromaticiconvertens TaxID=365341 RepID=UPI003018660A
MEFTGKVVLITGAGSGLGRAASLAFAREGASLCLLGRSLDKLQETGRLIREGGGHCVELAFDLGNAEDCIAAIASAIAAFGRLDVLCNIAADVMFHQLSAITVKEWHRTIASNLSGPFFLMQAAMPHLVESHGNIVSVASTAGFMGQAYLAPYTASKFGLVGLTLSLAMEMMNSPVRINVLAPGPMRTEMTQGMTFPDFADPKLLGRYTGMRPPCPPEDVVEPLLFLASERARRVHGACWAVDGGIMAG